MMSQLAKRAIPLKPADARETDGQWQAIYDTGEDIWCLRVQVPGRRLCSLSESLNM